DLRIRGERLAERPHEGGGRGRRRWQRREPHDRGAPRGRRVHLGEHRRAGAAHLEVRRQDPDRQEAHARPRRRRAPRDR
ncbi:MAG: Cell division protein FtsZ, partial [uncultured Gemmatimonadaceae bacterium]